MTKTVVVYEVVVDTKGPGKYGDGIEAFRFRTHADALEFSRGHTYYGQPAAVCPVEVSRKLAVRWGVA